MNEVEKELRAASKVAPKKGEAEQAYLKRLFDKANGLDDAGWKALSEEAQLWCNAASEARETKSDIPGFGTTEEAEDEEDSKKAEQVEETESEAEDEDTEVKVKSTKAKSAKKSTAKAKTAKPAKAAKPTEKAAKAAKAKPTTKAKSGNGAGPRKGSLTAKVAEMLQAKKGCTRADILGATGWPSVSVQQLAANAGLKLRKVKEGRIFRYHAD